MNILLVKPYNLSDHIQPSLGLGYLATAIRNNHNVEILDCIKEDIKSADFYDYIEGKDLDVIGFQCYTYDLANLRIMLKACKKKKAVTLLGGPHPSALPRETMECFDDDLDYCFQGEAEAGLAMLLDGLSGKSKLNKQEIPGLVWRDKNQIVLNEKIYINDLDKLGMPAWDLIKPYEYPEAQHGAFFKNFPIAPITITRGCPYSCTFCAGNFISGKIFRKRSARHVVEEIKTLHDKYGIREIHITDDNFTLDKDFAKDVLRHIKQMDFKISWSVPNGIRAESLDEELLSLMKETGLYLISLGIESGSDRILKLMKKNTTTSLMKDTIERIRKFDIDIAGFFIIGFPGETLGDIERTIQFSLDLDIIRANFFTYLPFPGTESYEYIKQKEGLDKVDWEKFYFFSASYSPEGMDVHTLKKLQRKAFVKFYSRPRIFWKNIRGIKSLRHFKFLAKRFFHWILMK